MDVDHHFLFISCSYLEIFLFWASFHLALTASLCFMICLIIIINTPISRRVAITISNIVDPEIKLVAFDYIGFSITFISTGTLIVHIVVRDPYPSDPFGSSQAEHLLVLKIAKTEQVSASYPSGNAQQSSGGSWMRYLRLM